MTIRVEWAEPELTAKGHDDVPFALPSISQIIDETAAKYRLQRLELLSDRRQRMLVYARQEAMYRAYMETTHSFPFIGRMFNRDHTTVLYAVRAHQERNGLPVTALQTKPKRHDRPKGD